MSLVSNVATQLRGSFLYKRKLLLHIIDALACAVSFEGENLDDFIEHLRSRKELSLPPLYRRESMWYAHDPRTLKDHTEIIVIGAGQPTYGCIKNGKLIIGGAEGPWNSQWYWTFSPVVGKFKVGDSAVTATSGIPVEITGISRTFDGNILYEVMLSDKSKGSLLESQLVPDTRVPEPKCSDTLRRSGDAVVYSRNGAHIHLRGKVGKINEVRNEELGRVSFVVQFSSAEIVSCHAHEINKLPRPPQFCAGAHVLVTLGGMSKAGVVKDVTANSEGKFLYLVALTDGERGFLERDIQRNPIPGAEP